MNRLVTHASTPFALLAIMLLPVQQSLATTCSCQGGQDRVNQTSAGSPSHCCSQHGTSCCSGASGHRRSCGEKDSRDSKSKPCQCASGCYKKATPDAVDPATIGLSWENDLPVAAVLSISTIGCKNATRDSVAHLVATSPVGGSELCVRLCRYRF